MSAWRESADSERASSSISRALAMASAAWSARARTSPTCGAANASFAVENVPSAPNTSSPATIGRDHHGPDPDLVDEPVGHRAMVEALVRLVVAGDDDAPVRHGTPEHAHPDRELQPADPVVRADRVGPGVVGEPQAAGGRVEQVQDRAVGREQPRRLLRGVAQEVIDARAAPGRRRSTGSAAAPFGSGGASLAVGAGVGAVLGRRRVAATVRTSLPAAPNGDLRHPSRPGIAG